MIDEKELRRLAQRSSVAPDVDGVIHRGDTMRRRRTAARFVVAASALAVVVAAFALRFAQDPTEIDSADGGSDDPALAMPDCGGFTDERDADEAGVPLLVPGWLPDGVAIDRAVARAAITNTLTCPPIPVALVAWRADPSGEITAGVRLLVGDGPQYQHYDGPTYETTQIRHDASAVVASGFHDPTAEYLELTWTEPDETTWRMSSRGLDIPAAKSVAENLELHGSGGSPVADLAAPVAGLEVGWKLESMPDHPPAEEPSWWVLASGVELTVTRPLAPFPAVAMADRAGARLVEVRGHTGISVATDSGGTILIWDEAPGLNVELQAPYDLATVLRIADALEVADPDDPRIN